MRLENEGSSVSELAIVWDEFLANKKFQNGLFLGGYEDQVTLGFSGVYVCWICRPRTGLCWADFFMGFKDCDTVLGNTQLAPTSCGRKEGRGMLLIPWGQYCTTLHTCTRGMS